MFQADARQANDLLATASTAAAFASTTAPAATSTSRRCRSSSVDKKLSGGQQFNLVHNELISKGFNNPNKKYVVWLDSGSRYCGQGQLYQDTRRTQANNNNLRTTAIVYRPYATGDPATGGFCRGRTLLHEVGHNLGALQGAAPNAFDGAHCDDSAEDVMCYTSATSNDTGGRGLRLRERRLLGRAALVDRRPQPLRLRAGAAEPASASLLVHADDGSAGRTSAPARGRRAG